MKLTSGKFGRKIRKLRDRTIIRLHSHLNRKVRLLLLLKEDIVMEAKKHQRRNDTWGQSGSCPSVIPCLSTGNDLYDDQGILAQKGFS
jgi:hypothetical protein